MDLKEQLVPRRPRRPWKAGKLVGPGKRTGKYLCVAFSEIDENNPWAGAVPEEGLLRQLLQGPCSWPMFYSCVGFVLPAAIHLWKREHATDLFAGVALLCVAITSPLCDAFCVYSAVYEDGQEAASDPSNSLRRYTRTAVAVQLSQESIVQLVQDRDAYPQILATDRWNNLTRLLDRTVCLFLVAPATVGFAWYQRPRLEDLLLLLLVFLLAWMTCVWGQAKRMAYPAGIKRLKDGSIVTDDLYGQFTQLHIFWHVLLIVLFTGSALYRPVEAP